MIGDDRNCIRIRRIEFLTISTSWDF